MIKGIVFIYNADAGVLAAALDSARKLVGSEKGCALCTITHGLLGEKADWEDAECRLGLPTTYYHRDEVPADIRSFLAQRRAGLPAVLFEQEPGGYELAVGSEELERCQGDPRRLLAQVQAALEASTAT